MSLENVREHLRKYGKDQDIILFEKSSATVKEAAEDLGTEEGRKDCKDDVIPPFIRTGGDRSCR